MRLREQFVRALGEVEAGQSEPASPSQLCRISAGLLDAAGAGLVMSQPLIRLPVGASDEVARIAEEVQAGLGSGPCLTVERTGAVLAADQADLARYWPAYQQELARLTPYRSTVSFPLTHARVGFGALTVYYTDSTTSLPHELTVVQDELADLVGVRLLLHEVVRQHDDAPTDERRRRHQVWIAVGMLQEAGGSSDTDAMALLRAYAFRTGRLIGDVATDLVLRSLSAKDVLDDLV